MKIDSTSKKPKKGSICEEDVSTLLRRYPATAVLSLLQEVASFPDSMIDWNALVKNTTTGISNAREYQMLWRHLAYRNALLDKPEDGAEPLDDDSDLEFELEAYPTVNSDVSADIAACVKVLITSGLPSSSIVGNLSVEAPLTINVPNGQSSRAASANKQPSSSTFGTNITVPVSVHKHHQSTIASEGLDGNGNIPPRKRRKTWSKAEDLELEAAVEKFGEGNWVAILQGNFRGDRTASQLSQRWATIRKRKNSTVENTKSSGSQLSEAQVEAARHAMSVALNMPSRRPVIVSGISSKLPQNHSHQTKPSPTEPTSTQKPTSTINTSSPNPSLDPDLGIKAAAVAAGGRIATAKDAASLLIAAQAKKAVHIIPSSGSRIKCSVPGPSSLRPGTFQLSSTSQVASIRSSVVKTAPLAKTPVTTLNAKASEQEANEKAVACETSNVSQSREDGASCLVLPLVQVSGTSDPAKSTSEAVKESEMRFGTNISEKGNVDEEKDGDVTNSGKKTCSDDSIAVLAKKGEEM